MRILHCVLLLAFAILLKNVYCDSSNPSLPLHNSPPTPSYLSLFPKPTASPFEIPETNTKLDDVHPKAPTPIPSIPDVTSYLLAVLQWPPGVCTAGKSGITCKKPWPAEFTIHGLWPRYPEVDPPKKSTEIFGNQVLYTATYTDLILAFAIHLKNVYCDSSNPSPPLPNSPLSYLSSLPKPKVSPFEIPATNTKLGEVHPQAPTPLQISKVTSYILAVGWAPSFCYGKKYPPFTCIDKKNWPDDFTIHGLWPQYSVQPVKSTEIFTYKKISKLRTRMEKNWRSLKKGFGKANPDEVLWEGEWDKHGTESEMVLLDYFKNTLDLFDKVLAKSNPKGILKALSAQKIIPKNTKKTKYKLQDITDALHKIYGVTCSISCVKNEKDNSLEQFLEIRFTFTRGPGQNDFQMQNTVKSETSDSCSGTDVWFPLI